MARLVAIGVRFKQHIAEVADVLVVDEVDLDGLPAEYRAGLTREDDGRVREMHWATYLVTREPLGFGEHLE